MFIGWEDGPTLLSMVPVVHTWSKRSHNSLCLCVLVLESSSGIYHGCWECMFWGKSWWKYVFRIAELSLEVKTCSSQGGFHGWITRAVETSIHIFLIYLNFSRVPNNARRLRHSYRTGWCNQTMHSKPWIHHFAENSFKPTSHEWCMSAREVVRLFGPERSVPHDRFHPHTHPFHF